MYLQGAVDQAKISSEKFTYASFRPELCPILAVSESSYQLRGWT
jgi:hypothetical protein